jgi:hypothetical protein
VVERELLFSRDIFERSGERILLRVTSTERHAATESLDERSSPCTVSVVVISVAETSFSPP